MRFTAAPAAAFLSAALLALPAFAQEDEKPQDPQKVKEQILEKVRARLQEEHTKILDRIAKLIDEELARAAKEKEKEKEKEPRKDPEKGPRLDGDAAKKLKEIEKKLRELDDQREELQSQVRALKREVEDAPLKVEAEKEIPEDGSNYQEIFEEYLNAHNEKDFKVSIRGFKKLYYRFAGNRGGAVCAYNVACGYALAGDKDQALDWIDLSIKSGYDQPGDYEHMRKDSDLDSLRKERRYQKMMLDK